MANNSGGAPHVQVPSTQPNYDVSSEAPLGNWESIDSRSGICEPGTFNVVKDWPSEVWVQA